MHLELEYLKLTWTVAMANALFGGSITVMLGLGSRVQGLYLLLVLCYC